MKGRRWLHLPVHQGVLAFSTVRFIQERHYGTGPVRTATAEITGSFVTGAFPHDNQITMDGKRIYNASHGDMTLDLDERDNVDQPTEDRGWTYQITLADTGTLDIIDRFRFDTGVRPFHLADQERTIYAQFSNTHAIIAYDIETKQVTNRIDMPVHEGVTPDDWDFETPHHGLAITPDEKILCAAGRASDYAGLVEADGLNLLATVPVGDAPSWSVIDETGTYCIVSNTRSDNVSIVSIADQKEIARLPTGDYPKHMSIGRVSESVLAGLRDTIAR